MFVKPALLRRVCSWTLDFQAGCIFFSIFQSFMQLSPPNTVKKSIHEIWTYLFWKLSELDELVRSQGPLKWPAKVGEFSTSWNPSIAMDHVFFLEEEIHWVVVSNIFYFHPYLGKISNLTNIFQMRWNHQLVQYIQTINFGVLNLVFSVCKLYNFTGVFCTKWSFQLPPLPVSKSLNF